MSRDGSKVELLYYTNQLTNGNSFTVVSLDVYGDSDSEQSVDVYCTGDYLACESTMTKTSSSSSTKQSMKNLHANHSINLNKKGVIKLKTTKTLSFNKLK